MKNYLIAFCLLAFSISAQASDIEDLAKQGYAVVAETRVKGSTFEGCDFDKIIAFTNGYGLQCRQYKYNYSYNPKVYILMHVQTQDVKVIINNREFKGRVGRLY